MSKPYKKTEVEEEEENQKERRKDVKEKVSNSRPLTFYTQHLPLHQSLLIVKFLLYDY